MTAPNQVELVPLTQEQLDAWLPGAIASYAQQHVASGRWGEAEALQRSREEHATLLPAGVASPGQHLWSIVRSTDREKVGMVWMAERAEPVRHGWVYNIEIDDSFRRRGYAEQAMLALEGEARALGLDSIRLHVFGHNQAAIPLYKKLGYVPTNILMAKDLDGG